MKDLKALGTILVNSSTNSNLTLIKKLERILRKIYRHNVSLLSNQTCLNERLLPNYPHTHTHTHIYIYIYIYIHVYIYIYIGGHKLRNGTTTNV